MLRKRRSKNEASHTTMALHATGVSDGATPGGLTAGTGRLGTPVGGAWSSFAVTKFRTPMRRDLVSRPQLLQRALALATERRVSLICAPAGFGKSTLLLQLVDELNAPAYAAHRVTSTWLSLDENDSNINRLLVSLLGALRDVALKWDVEPHILASQVQAAGPSSSAAVAALINALASYRGKRLLLILDDLHRISDVDALCLLSELIDGLPPEVGVVIGSRIEPAIPIARWRARGELGELVTRDLQFTQADALALTRLYPDRNVSPEHLRLVMQRTEGWAVGIQLALAASGGEHSVHPDGSGSAQRHLFDFFAQEVITDLPPELREFVLQCSILSELSPSLCNAVTERNDAAAILVSLSRRNLFLTMIDESIPALRFHDLFAEFLQAQLAQCQPGLAHTLHARAAQVEPNALRAVAHWLKAERWNAAVGVMMECAEALLAEGGGLTLMRWLAQLPQTFSADNPDVIYLRALYALNQWRFMHAAACFDRAARMYRERGDLHALMRCVALLPRSCVSIGELDRAARALKEADALPMSPSLRVICDGARAWLAVAGKPEACAPALAAIADHAAGNPDLLLPAINDIFNPFMFGMPNVIPQMLRLRQLCRRHLAAGAVHWQLDALAYSPWPELWQGSPDMIERAFEQYERMMLRLSVVPVLALADNPLRASLAIFRGDFPAALRQLQANIEFLSVLDDEGLTNTWLRYCLVSLSHIYWMTGDASQLEACWPEMSSQRTQFEWPMIDTCREMLRGRIAILSGRFDDAEAALTEAVRLQAYGRVPLALGDARCSLAICLLLHGHTDLARQTFLPIFEEVLSEDCIGVLLMESAAYRERLLGLLPDEILRQPRAQALLERLAQWQVDKTTVTQPSSDAKIAASLVDLSAREREILVRIAAGDSNKQIAKTFSLSPHTVKRHVANILAKLDCSTRGQAAARWRNAAH